MDSKRTVADIIKVREPNWWELLVAKFIKCGNVPKHVVFILDGNRRYAKENKLDYHQSYLRGLAQIFEILVMGTLLDIEEVSVFAFSIENFKRSQKEVDCLMDLLLEFAEEILKNPVTLKKIGFRFIGNTELNTEKHQKAFAKAALESKRNSPKIFLNLFCSYTARFDIARSVDKLALACLQGKIDLNDITEQTAEKGLFTQASHPPNVLIRSSGEIRFSDFMLWQANHSSLKFISKMWPEVTSLDVVLFILEYQYQHLLQDFTKKTSQNQCQSHSFKTMKRFISEYENNYHQHVLMGKVCQKLIPVMEDRE